MTTLADLLYVMYFAAVGPLIDYVFFWPAFHRRSEVDLAKTRTSAWAWTIGSSWLLVAVGAGIWVWNGRSWSEFGFIVPEGWRLWTSIAVILLAAVYYGYAVITLARSGEERTKLREQFGTLNEVDAVLPHTRREMYWFGGVSLTAGFCEEFLFRGYFIWFFAPWIGWWGAAVLSLLIFAGWHAYQGWNGVLRVGIVGGIYALVLAIFNSLWPAIALHVLVDLANGMMAWLVLREGKLTSEIGKRISVDQ